MLRTGDHGFIATAKLLHYRTPARADHRRRRNHFPTDIESSVESLTAIASSGAVAFSLDLDGAER